jgi:DnaJ-class molecular chaperone
MRRLTEQNYYELLGVSPRDSFEEIQAAYDEAVNTYSGDSVATYSLLTPEERQHVLTRLVDAYKTLTNSHLRREYNQLLIEKGEVSPQELGPYSVEETARPEGELKEVSVESFSTDEKTGSQGETYGSNLDLFDGYASVTGRSIKMVRLARDMSLEEVYRKTNVPKQTLEAIEEDDYQRLPALVYLKGFLKVYADALKVDPAQMVDGYVKRFLEWRTTDRK